MENYTIIWFPLPKVWGIIPYKDGTTFEEIQIKLTEVNSKMSPTKEIVPLNKPKKPKVVMPKQKNKYEEFIEL